MRFISALSLVILIIGLSAWIYTENAASPAERAARLRGCLLCHTHSFAEQALPCLQQWQHGTPLTPVAESALLQAHPTLAGDDAPLLAQYIAGRQLPLLLRQRGAERGAALYAAKCAACHGHRGEGQTGTYPPLHGSEWLTPAPGRPTPESIITRGLQGPITVKGEAWDSAMLPPGITDPQDVQSLIEYLQRRFGSK